MVAIPCRYTVPYKAYPFIYGGPSVATGAAFADFALDPGAFVALYTDQSGFEIPTYLVLTLPEWDGVGFTARTFSFIGDGSGTGAPGFQIAYPALATPTQLMTALAASITANTGFLVTYTGGLTMRLTQPVAGAGALAEGLNWTSVSDVLQRAPVHPSGMVISGQYAPVPLGVPGVAANGRFAVDTVGFVAADLVGLTMQLDLYPGIGLDPLIPTFIHFVAAPQPPLANNAYVVIAGGETAAQVSALMQAAFLLLGWDIAPFVSPESFIISQPAYGPGGVVFILPSGTAADPGQLLFSGSGVPTEPIAPPNASVSFSSAVGFNYFLIPSNVSGPYGGNVVPIRWGMNYGVVPLPPPSTEPID